MRHKPKTANYFGAFIALIVCSTFALVGLAGPASFAAGSWNENTWEPASSDPENHFLLQGGSDCAGCSHDELIIRRWSWKHFPKSYAGIFFVKGKLMVGYTERQSARVRAVKQLPSLVNPRHVSAFSYVPKHSLGELNALQERVVDDVMRNEAHAGLLVSVGVDVRRNLVEVGSEHVKRAGKILKGLYGLNAPILVRYEKPPVEV